jgi:hypothetical protein
MSTSTVTTQQTQRSFRLAGEEQIKSAESDAQFQSVARGDRNGTLKLRGIPTFSDPLEKRKWMKEHMAAAFRYFGKMGYAEGVSGHISMRGILQPFQWETSLLAAANLSLRPCSERPLLDEPLCQALFHHQGLRSGLGGQ